MKKCKKCQAEFPSYILIDGVKKSLYSRSYCLACSPWGVRNARKLSLYKIIDGLEHRYCRQCHQWSLVADFRSNGSGGLASSCQTCSATSITNRRRHLKRWAIEYKGGICVDCGVSKLHESAFDFHHLDLDGKDFRISQTRNKDKMIVELDKCILLCANCHRVRHFDATHPNYLPHL